MSTGSQSKEKCWNSVLSLKTMVFIPSATVVCWGRTVGSQFPDTGAGFCPMGLQSPLLPWYSLPGNASWPLCLLLSRIIPSISLCSLSLVKSAIIISQCAILYLFQIHVSWYLVFSIKYFFCYQRACNDSVSSANNNSRFLSGLSRNF